jgi:hypothetical protein
MNLQKTLSSAALLLASTALLAGSLSATTLPKLNAPTYTVNNTTNYGTATAPIYLDSTASPLALTIVPGADDASGYCYYTTTGVAPTTSSPACPTTPILLPAVGGAKTAYKIEVLVTATGYTQNTATFNITAESQITTPTFTPTTSAGATVVTIGDTWVSSGSAYAKIKYTLDGSDPATSSTAVSLAYKPSISGYPPFTIADNDSEVTLTAVAEATGFINSVENAGSFGTSYGTGHSNFIAAGSSAQFFEYALAFAGTEGNGSASGGVCGSHHFTKKNGAQAADVRSGVTPADTGNLLIVWDNSASYAGGSAPTKVCVYLSLDSTLGVKAFLNSNLTVPAEFLNITSSTSPSNSISPFWAVTGTTADEASIPADVLAAAQGQPFNAGVTDIRPEDAKFATTRALTTLNATRTGLGYGPGPIGTAIVSVAGTTFNVVDFALSGADKISSAKQQPYTTVPIGAAPVVVFVNTTAGTSGDGLYHFGDTTNPVKNVSRFTLAGYLNGTVTGTGAVAPVALSTTSQASAPVNVWLREPLSGTYNTMEFNIPASKEIGSSQEIGVNPIIKGSCAGSTSARLTTCTGAADANGNSGNPLFIKVYPTAAGITTNPLGNVNSSGVMIGVAGATRQRAIGTGEEVKQVALKGADNIGYSFWGFGNLSSGNNNAAASSSAPANTKYITVDGVDPINAEYSSGTIPWCDATNYTTLVGCPTPVTFNNVINGSYPIWSIYRAVIPNPTSPTQAQTNELTFIHSVLAAAESASSTVQDFVPLSQLQVFRSHYKQAGVAPQNGHVSGEAEAGGDVGGAVFTIQADHDNIAQYGTEIVNVKQ